MIPLVRAVACETPARIGESSRAKAWFAPSRMLLALSSAMLLLFAGLVVAPRRTCGWGETKSDVAALTVVKYAFEAYPSWREQHPTRMCPEKLEELDAWMNKRDALDPWGTEYRFFCGDRGLVVVSAGEDCRFGTGDDITSLR